MQYPMPGSCPVCSAELAVTRLACRNCGSELTGRFATCPFCQLTTEQRSFLLTFLRARGSIKEVERALGISYPTVRGRLRDLLAALGLPAGADEAPPVDRTDVLDRLAAGDLTPEEAAGLLKGTRKKR